MRPHRVAWATSIILWHLFSSWIARPFIRDPKRLRAFYLWKVHVGARWLQRALGMKMVVEGRENLKPGHNYLIVANHLGYLDAVLMSGFLECAYVTSVEMKNTPLLGQIVELGGCLFVERRSKDNIKNEIGEIEEALRQGFHVTVFPEATSTEGEAVRPFKRPLFAAAANAPRPVLPMVIQFHSIDGEPVTKANRDAVCWYGDMTFGRHFLKLTSIREITVKLKILPEIPVTKDSTRDTLMEEAYRRIVSAYEPIR